MRRELGKGAGAMFFLMAAPLSIQNGSGSPLRPVALF
jgi:kynurenine formamidase